MGLSPDELEAKGQISSKGDSGIPEALGSWCHRRRQIRARRQGAAVPRSEEGRCLPGSVPRSPRSPRAPSGMPPSFCCTGSLGSTLCNRPTIASVESDWKWFKDRFSYSHRLDGPQGCTVSQRKHNPSTQTKAAGKKKKKQPERVEINKPQPCQWLLGDTSSWNRSLMLSTVG